MIIKIRNKEAAPMGNLFRLVLKSIFEPQNMSQSERQLMQDSIVNWHNNIMLRKELGKEYENDEYYLSILATLLKQDEEGKLDRKKWMIEQYGLDYKKMYKLPEAYVSKDFVLAQQALAKCMKDHPGDYQ